MKICFPIQETSQTKIFELFTLWENQCDIFEVWLDSIENLNISTLIATCPKPIICVCKAAYEKGKFQGTEESRIEILIEAAKAGADFVDIGIHTNKALIEKFKKEKHKTQLILSFHNWDTTPKMTTMLTRIDEMLFMNPEIIKYVATAQSIEDNIQIFRLTENLKKKNIKCITMCMGNFGKISRIITPFLGSEWMYAPYDKTYSSAPGQIDAHTLKNIWENINIV